MICKCLPWSQYPFISSSEAASLLNTSMALVSHFGSSSFSGAGGMNWCDGNHGAVGCTRYPSSIGNRGLRMVGGLLCALALAAAWLPGVSSSPLLIKTSSLPSLSKSRPIGTLASALGPLGPCACTSWLGLMPSSTPVLALGSMPASVGVMLGTFAELGASSHRMGKGLSGTAALPCTPSSDRSLRCVDSAAMRWRTRRGPSTSRAVRVELATMYYAQVRLSPGFRVSWRERHGKGAMAP
mmetsp:Transcript_119119/g.337694  ORF Transcript_119119/g.337694 Transcript_119119/m.337694 type:complete len:240 (-) Transcript_119119:2-721(-)